MKKIVFVVNDATYFISHRMAIGVELISKGYKVYVIAPEENFDTLLQNGFIMHSVNMTRKGKNPLFEAVTVWNLMRAFKKIKPDLVHLVTIKPYLYGGVAARLAGVPAVVSAVAGLGVLFSQHSLKVKVLRGLLYPFYSVAFGHKNQVAIFQNMNDCDLLVNWGVLDQKKIALIRGAGADLTQYSFSDEPCGVPIVSFAARLLIDKGVDVFAEASRILKSKNILVRFWLIGEPDLGNANTITEKQLHDWESEGLVELLGFRKDIPNLLAKSNIVTLPSFYGEGLPKVLVEAAACGRAVITTDHPGCRDAIEPNITGILIPIRDPLALADAIEYLIQNPVKRNSMGRAGRALAEHQFAIEKIVDAHMKIYTELL